MERTALGEAILSHWREHCPQMVRDLEKQNRLDQAVLEAQETTGDLLYELVSVKKMNYPAAWELATQEWAPYKAFNFCHHEPTLVGEGSAFPSLSAACYALQFSEQPPIMQQLFCPQPAGAAAALLFVLTEKVESWGSSLRVWQLGHSAFCSPKRIASNLCPHCSQRYSKIGIATPINFRGMSFCASTNSRARSVRNDTTIIDAAA